MGKTFLSGYRIMWMFVFFDLPTLEKDERREYSQFRNFLLDLGFLQAQYSVYYRPASGKEGIEKITRAIEERLPGGGKVQLISITDKQYENMYTFVRRKPKKKGNDDQLSLF